MAYEDLQKSIFGSPAPDYYVNRAPAASSFSTMPATLAPAVSAAPAASGGSFFSGLGNLLGGVLNSGAAQGLAQGVGYALAGRQPKPAELYGNPLAQNAGYAGQPNTTPVVGQSGVMTASIMPYLLIAGAVVAGVALVKALK